MAANGGIKGKLNKPSHGGNTVNTFTASGSFTTQQGTTEVDVLTVAGGGSGGASTSGAILAGGGGAGGFRNLTSEHVLSNSTIAVTVGARFWYWWFPLIIYSRSWRCGFTRAIKCRRSR